MSHLTYEQAAYLGLEAASAGTTYTRHNPAGPGETFTKKESGNWLTHDGLTVGTDWVFYGEHHPLRHTGETND